MGLIVISSFAAAARIDGMIASGCMMDNFSPGNVGTAAATSQGHGNGEVLTDGKNEL
jgi:hypothetical protein